MPLQSSFTVTISRDQIWRSRRNPMTSRIRIRGVDPENGLVFFTPISMVDHPVRALNHMGVSELLGTYEPVRQLAPASDHFGTMNV